LGTRQIVGPTERMVGRRIKFYVVEWGRQISSTKHKRQQIDREDKSNVTRMLTGGKGIFITCNRFKIPHESILEATFTGKNERKGLR
jgi:methyl coenzyme M reductase beta subunit